MISCKRTLFGPSYAALLNQEYALSLGFAAYLDSVVTVVAPNAGHVQGVVTLFLLNLLDFMNWRLSAQNCSPSRRVGKLMRACKQKRKNTITESSHRDLIACEEQVGGWSW